MEEILFGMWKLYPRSGSNTESDWILVGPGIEDQRNFSDKQRAKDAAYYLNLGYHAGRHDGRWYP